MANIERLCPSVKQIPSLQKWPMGKTGHISGGKDTSWKHGLTCKGGGGVDLASPWPMVSERWR